MIVWNKKLDSLLNALIYQILILDPRQMHFVYYGRSTQMESSKDWDKQK